MFVFLATKMADDTNPQQAIDSNYYYNNSFHEAQQNPRSPDDNSVEVRRSLLLFFLFSNTIKKYFSTFEV